MVWSTNKTHIIIVLIKILFCQTKIYKITDTRIETIIDALVSPNNDNVSAKIDILTKSTDKIRLQMSSFKNVRIY